MNKTNPLPVPMLVTHQTLTDLCKILGIPPENCVSRVVVDFEVGSAVRVITEQHMLETMFDPIMQAVVQPVDNTGSEHT